MSARTPSRPNGYDHAHYLTVSTPIYSSLIIGFGHNVCELPLQCIFSACNLIHSQRRDETLGIKTGVNILKLSGTIHRNLVTPPWRKDL